MNPPDSSLPELVGRYRVIRELGKGAMGRVLLAHDPILDRHVAIKHLRSDLQIAPEQKAPLLERMRQEARASARVSHPNLVALHDMGEDPVLHLFLVFEYVAGPTLRERLERGPLKLNEAATLAREVGNALAFAHEAGVVHRDIKPDNVILSRTGAKIADFGIARVPDSTLTQGGSILGTPAYSAPEAIRSGKFSPRSDQFSMAATLYEAISGRRAFPGEEAVTVATRIANDEPPRIADVCGIDRMVDTVLARGLSKHPRSRYDSCARFGEALAMTLLPPMRPQLPTEPDALHTLPKPTRTSWTLPVFAAALGAAGSWFTMNTVHSQRRAQLTVTAPSKFDEEDPQAVAWLEESPDDHLSNEKDDTGPRSGAKREATQSAKTVGRHSAVSPPSPTIDSDANDSPSAPSDSAP
jgi:eukaryotic-like serine/threonine-protein kinase